MNISSEIFVSLSRWYGWKAHDPLHPIPKSVFKSVEKQESYLGLKVEVEFLKSDN